MANKLTQLRADEVSAVDKAANRKKFLILKRATESVEKVIKHEGDKWVIYSQDGTKALGTYDTKKEASDRLAEIERFKKEKVAKTILGGWLLSALRKAAGNSGPTTEVEDMTAEEIKKAIADGAAEALTPINERIEKLEAAVAAPAAGAADGADPAAAATGAVAKKEGDAPDEGTPTTPTAEDIAKMVTDGMAAALQPLADRIENLEKVQGERQSALDEAGAHQVKKSAEGFWEGSGLLL